MSLRRADVVDNRDDIMEVKDAAVLYPKIASVKLAQGFKRSLCSKTSTNASGRKSVFKKLELFVTSNHLALLYGQAPSEMKQVRGVPYAHLADERLSATIEEVSAA